MNVKKKMRRIIRTAALTAAAAAGWALLLAQTSGGFRFFGPISRIITPNGDGFNDVAILCVDNPSGSGVDAKIYTLLGANVASMSGPVPAPAGCSQQAQLPGSLQALTWDGRAGGGLVHSGVYVYEVKAEGQAFTGTLLVVR